MILVFGANGQLGTDICKQLEDHHIDFLPIFRQDCDISDSKQIISFLEHIEFSVLINCTSYHKTDEVEDNPKQAILINSSAVSAMAKLCEHQKAKLIHFSTDYVFGGFEDHAALTEESIPCPINVYGASKLLGENQIRAHLKSYYIFRVASLFGIAGSSGKGGNFIETIISKAKVDESLRVVDDQVMSPTHTKDIASTVIYFLQNNFDYGLYNLVNDGYMSWYELAEFVLKECKLSTTLEKISSNTLNLKALRPSYSVLSIDKIKSLGVKMPSCESAVREYLILRGHTS